MKLLNTLDLQALFAAAAEKFLVLKSKKCALKDGAKRAALSVWARLTVLFAAVCACFRRPGLSEVAAVTALAIAAVGGIVSVFKKSWRKLAPLFAVLAALGTLIVVLRCLFPRSED